MFWCTCASCGIQRPVLYKIRETSRPVCRGGRSGYCCWNCTRHVCASQSSLDGKKALEIRRCYGSEALRNPKLQKNTIYYTLDRLNPMIHNVGAQAMNQLSTKLRPTKKYKTNRKDLNGGAVDIRKLIGKIPKPKGGWTPGKYKYMGP